MQRQWFSQPENIYVKFDVESLRTSNLVESFHRLVFWFLPRNQSSTYSGLAAMFTGSHPTLNNFLHFAQSEMAGFSQKVHSGEATQSDIIEHLDAMDRFVYGKAV